jgi:carboxymethylenebutenolidase
MDQKIIDLFDEFTHGAMPRRTFLRRLAVLAGGVAAAQSVLPLLENNYARAAILPETDRRITTREESYKAGDVTISGYWAMPRPRTGERPGTDFPIPVEKGGPYPAVMVIHENRGLNPHIKDVTRRVALEGFAAFAPDMLSPLGGTPEDPDKARELLYTLKNEETLERLKAGLAHLRALRGTTGKTGVIGFCWGGGMVNALAVADPELNAAVSYYGRQAPAGDVPEIEAPLMLHYGEKDERINAGIPDYEAALKAAGKTHEIFIYEGAQHAFNNDTNEARYDKEAADLAWSRTTAFLKKHLGS